MFRILGHPPLQSSRSWTCGCGSGSGGGGGGEGVCVCVCVCVIIDRINKVISYCIPSFIFTYPLTAGVVGAPQMTSRPVSSIFLCSPLLSGTWQTPGLSIPRCCLPTSFSVCLVVFPFSLCLARWCWPDLMNGRLVHSTSVCVSLRQSGGSSCGPTACWNFAQTSPLVTWSLYELCSILRQHLIFMVRILCISVV